MSTLETFVGQMTVGDLVARAGISVTDLLDRVGPIGPSSAEVHRWTTLSEGMRREQAAATRTWAAGAAAHSEGMRRAFASTAKPAAKKAKTPTVPSSTTKPTKGQEIGNLASPAHRDRFDASIVDLMRGKDPMKLDAIYVALPWSNKERGQVGRAMVRLKKAGIVSASGNTLSRIYKLVKN